MHMTTQQELKLELQQKKTQRAANTIERERGGARERRDLIREFYHVRFDALQTSDSLCDSRASYVLIYLSADHDVKLESENRARRHRGNSIMFRRDRDLKVSHGVTALPEANARFYLQ